MKLPSQPSASAPARNSDGSLGQAFATLERLAKTTAQGTLAAIEVSLAPVPAHHLLRLSAADESSFLWSPTAGATVAGVGAAGRLVAQGPRRFTSIQQQSSMLWPRLRGDCAGPLRLFGGFSFDDGDLSDSPWHELGQANFVLPRVGYEVLGHEARLRLIVSDFSTASMRYRAVGELESLLGELQRPAALPAASPVAAEIVASPHGEWSARVEQIRGAIAAGDFSKIVAARSSSVHFATPIEWRHIIARLEANNADCFGFAFTSRGTTFLGATPERLARKHALELITEALAGSIDKNVVDAHQQLADSSKDRTEHDVVVTAIRQALDPLCTDVAIAPSPSVRELRHVLHLRSNIRARLRVPTHILDLVDRLHPTPAVGGTPSSSAVKWIAANEREPRGWYAAPVGWFDSNGDGEFAVAIRSGLIAGPKAHIFAGAGIVSGSHADAEYAETNLKMRPLLDALGVT